MRSKATCGAAFMDAPFTDGPYLKDHFSIEVWDLLAFQVTLHSLVTGVAGRSEDTFFETVVETV